MRGTIIRGGKAFQEEYILKFNSENKIKPYYISRYDEVLKIADARELKKNLSISSDPGEKRVYIISNEITIEAQNALLKTLEELSDENIIFFLSYDLLLPTIYSRCMVVDVEQQVDLDYSEASKVLRDVFDKKNFSYADIFSTSENLFPKQKQNASKEVLLALRDLLREKVHNGEDFTKIYSTIEKFIDKMPVISENNVNARLVFEKILLSI